MMFSRNPVYNNQIPNFDYAFTPNEIDELFSYFQPEPSSMQSISTSTLAKQGYTVVEEKKRKRRVSNQESAKRSRFRKKQHLENINIEVNRYKVENRELKNRVGMLTQKCHLIENESNRLFMRIHSLATKTQQFKANIVNHADAAELSTFMSSRPNIANFSQDH